jgi:hypothetical protein
LEKARATSRDTRAIRCGQAQAAEDCAGILESLAQAKLDSGAFAFDVTTAAAECSAIENHPIEGRKRYRGNPILPR